MRFVVLIAGLLAFLGPGTAWAGPEEDLEAMRADAVAIPGAVVTEFTDFTMVDDPAAMVFYYFTKPGHYAHPAAVRREVIQEGGAFYVGYMTWPHLGKDGPPGFLRWMEEFAELDRAMREAILRDFGR